ncbi:MAG: glycosyltransferase family 4 protein [Actinomycetota bacterium]|nr:glycosyltransferase family 4 protein [Actinomycetota bacterium]
MKVLVVTMYFPPAGGPGVQRPLKTAAHLTRLGFDVHVLAPDDPKWVHRDPSLQPPLGVAVHRARNLGPQARLRAEALFGARPFERLGTRALVTLRRVLVPDASVLWNLTAIPAALSLVRRERIDVVVTTSPPISVHFVGLAVKRATGARWVADLRDSFWSPDRRRHIRGERVMARLVARRADTITCATAGIAEEMRALRPGGAVQVIENACDFEDFDGLEYRPGERFRLTHTGTFVGRRNARPFFEALARTDGSLVARFVGGLRPADARYVEELGVGDRLDVVPFQPRDRTLALQRDSEALLLLLAEAGKAGRAILSAKLFEYLAAGRPILAVVPPDGEAAALVRETGAGIVVAPDDVDGIAASLAELERRWREGELEAPALSAELRARLSRRERAERLAALLRGLA